MIHRSLTAAVLSSCLMASPVLAQDGSPNEPDNSVTQEHEAFQAYNAGKYAQCAAAFEQAARAGSAMEAANSFYNAGCCHALAGNINAAIAMLQRAIDAGYANVINMAGDTDLANLRGDARMDALLEQIAGAKIVITDNVKHDPDEAQFIYLDAENFVRAMELVSAGADPVTTLEDEYFARATPGLKQMVVKYPFTAGDLAKAIQRYPEEYGRIAGNVALLRSRESDFRAAYRRYKQIAPDTVFAPTYFLVDRHRGIGSGSPDGQLISIESRTEESIGRMETLLIHELVHFQQLVATGPDEFYAIFGPKKTLLALTIREGTAEFFADYATGRMTQHDAVDYCLEHEHEIWHLFQDRMYERETDGWMWSTPDDPSVPRDLAYVLGSRIVRTYYDRADDKRQAVREILAVTDYPAFIEKCRYGEQFDD